MGIARGRRLILGTSHVTLQMLPCVCLEHQRRTSSQHTRLVPNRHRQAPALFHQHCYSRRARPNSRPPPPITNITPVTIHRQPPSTVAPISRCFSTAHAPSIPHPHVASRRATVARPVTRPPSHPLARPHPHHHPITRPERKHHAPNCEGGPLPLMLGAHSNANLHRAS
jgi:hypothetical protein